MSSQPESYPNSRTFVLEDPLHLNVNLENQQLKHAPDAILNKDSRCIRLSLAYNFLTSIPTSISLISQLKVLCLDHNELQSLPDTICQLQHLQTLNLSHNKLTQLPKGIGQLCSLRFFYLSDNLISELPLSLVNLKQLKKLSFHNNPVIFPPPHIWTTSPSSQMTEKVIIEKIMKYLHVAAACSESTSNVLEDPAECWENTAEFMNPFSSSVRGIQMESQFSLASENLIAQKPPHFFPFESSFSIPWEDHHQNGWDPVYALGLLRNLVDEMDTQPPCAKEPRALLQGLISFSIGVLFLLSHVYLAQTFVASTLPSNLTKEEGESVQAMFAQLTSLASLANKYLKSQSPGNLSWTSSAQTFHLLTKAYLKLSNSVKQILKPSFTVHPRLMRHSAGIIYQCMAEFKVCAEFLATVQDRLDGPP